VSYRQAPLFRSGVFVDTMEVAAPWSRLPDVYHTVRRALGRHVLVMAHFSHSYPDGGSIYFTFAGRAHGERSAVQVYDDAWRVGLSAALDAGATLSHHHGVGRNKAPRLGEESAGALRLLRALKRAWDPAGILNPGALLPAPSSAETRPVRAAESEPVLDAESDLVELPGALAVGAAEAWLGERGRTLALDPEAFRVWSRESVDAWIAAGLPGIRDAYADPAGTRLSGCIVRLSNGERIGLRAAPRRAVGPDVTRLFVGAEHAFGSVESAMLGAPRSDAGRPEVFSYAGEREPPVDSEERLAWDALEAALV
jgi:alkyldihydroxyacetonephosphate synthase